jgi:hypothetical protein
VRPTRSHGIFTDTQESPAARQNRRRCFDEPSESDLWDGQVKQNLDQCLFPDFDLYDVTCTHGFAVNLTHDADFDLDVALNRA